MQYIQAAQFSDMAHSVLQHHEDISKKYPNLRTQDLSSFRLLIECNCWDKWETLVWSNPRYLITQGDTPVILKPPTRYNALHCAVRSGSITICKKIFEILHGDRFWTMIYPNDSTEVRSRRKDHLIDLYLNTCDRGLQETPLHFACKYGHEEIMKFLLSLPLARDSSSRPNKYGKTPYDIACSNRIRGLLTAPPIFYVPVIRAVDNSVCPTLSQPCTLEELELEVLKSTHTSTLDSPVKSSAMVGPMPFHQAKQFFKKWQSPSKVKRSDPDRGMERRGRYLAQQNNLPWKEEWDFLGCCCDISNRTGLQKFEEFMTEKRFITGPEPSKIDQDVLVALEGTDLSGYANICRWWVSLKNLQELA